MKTITVVILGTGTDVGKTYVTRQLALALQRAFPQSPVTAIKPIESGIARLTTKESGPSDALSQSPPTPGHASSDAAQLATASKPNIQPAHAYSFPEPISPHRAARLNGVVIDVSRTTAWIDQFRRQPPEPSDATDSRPPDNRSWLLVESAGAAFSPINDTATNMQIAQALDPALWLLVAPDKLGVLHDLTTTLYAMRGCARAPDSVVLSKATSPADASSGTNAGELHRLGIVDVDTVVGRAESIDPTYILKLAQLAHDRGL